MSGGEIALAVGIGIFGGIGGHLLAYIYLYPILAKRWPEVYGR